MGRFLADFLEAAGVPAAEADRVWLPEPVPLLARLAVDELAADAVSTLALAIETARAAVGSARAGGSGEARIRLDPRRIAASFCSDRLGLLGGAPPAVWSPLSGFFRTADGWVRTHANYDWHARALARVLGVSPDADRETAARAISRWPAREIEAAAFAAGGLAVAVRETEEWAAERGPSARPFSLRRAGPATGPRRRGADPALPLGGLRVLDLTRVIAGPVATRALASLGADVLRVDAPDRPEILWQWLDTGRGKRSTLLDLAVDRDLSRFEALLGDADVVVTASRPGALSRFGLEPEQLAESHPRLVSARIRAWGGNAPGGPGPEWEGRRGFDSLVQAATGIARTETPQAPGAPDAPEGRPGAGSSVRPDPPEARVPGKLPAQALDHSGGALLAAGVVQLLAERRAGAVEVTLEGLARLLLAGGGARVDDPAGGGPIPTMQRPEAVPSDWGPLAIAGEAYRPAWQSEPGPWAGRPWGADAPDWRCGPPEIQAAGAAPV